MPEYSAVFKDRLVRRLVGPQAISANRLAAELGVPQATLARWRAAAEAALGTRAVRPGPSPDADRIRELERELQRKDQALAKTAALFVLKKRHRRSGRTRTIPRTRGPRVTCGGPS
jgi:hypothetical protein